MARPKPPIRLEAERLVKEMPEAPSRTLAKRLASEFKVKIETARTHVRIARGSHGKRHAKSAVVTREKQPAGWAPSLPESKAEEWAPVTLQATQIACLSDIHIPYHSKLAVEAAIAECKRRKPDAVLLNGDTLDFYTISRWIKDPRKRNFKDELIAGREFLRYVRHEFKDCQIVFKIGNHEDRWEHYLWNHAPEICDLPQVQLETILELDNIGVELVDQERPVMCGKLPVFHGHELPKGLTNPVNMARGAFLRMCDTVLVGHGHRTSTHTEPNWEHNETTTWSQGCLCDLNPRYARINKWNHGFAFIEVHSGGEFDLTNYRINSEGKVRKS